MVTLVIGPESVLTFEHLIHAVKEPIHSSVHHLL